MSRFRLLLVLIVLLATGWAGSAAAEVRVTFYSHGWGVGPRGETYFPHAFIRVQGAPAGGAPVDDTFGFTAKGLTTAVVNLPGLVQPANPRYLGDSAAHFWLVITDEQFQTLMARIAWWKSPDGSLYNIRSRNCLDFVADLAATLGLEPGNARTWKPLVFMTDTVKRNADKVILPDGVVTFADAPPSANAIAPPDGANP